MIQPGAAARVCGVLIGLAALVGCADSAPPPGQPSFYKDLAQSDAALDVDAAQSMISGYRSSNGLPPVTIDPELMQLASELAQAMAASDKLLNAVKAAIEQAGQISLRDLRRTVRGDRFPEDFDWSLAYLEKRGRIVARKEGRAQIVCWTLDTN